MRTVRTILALSTAGAALLSVAACSSSSHSATTAAATSAATSASTGATTTSGVSAPGTSAAASGAPKASTAASAAAASAGGSSVASQGKAIDVCAALPAATAKQLSGLDITSAVTSADLVGSGDAGCGYSNDDSTVQVQVQVFVAHGASTWQLASSAATNTKVAGVGDEAVYDGDGTLYAKKGGTTVQVNGIDSADKCATLAKAILAKL